MPPATTRALVLAPVLVAGLVLPGASVHVVTPSPTGPDPLRTASHAGPALVQEPRTPDSLATEFQTALRAAAWAAVAQRVHADARARFRRLVDILVEADTTGGTLGALFPEVGEGYRQMPDSAVLRVVMSHVAAELPGVVHSLSARDVTVLGTVREGDGLAHVVYRNADRLPGAEPEIRVMTLARGGPLGWGVLRSQELGLLQEGLRGVLRARPRPPGGRGP